MSQSVTLPKSPPSRALHLFAVNLSAADLSPLMEDMAALLTRLLGQTPDRVERIELIPVEDLEGLGLAGFLHEGPGIPKEVLAPHLARLEALEGHVLLLYPEVFDDAITLSLGADLTFIAALDAEPVDWSDTRTLTSAAATEPAPGTGKKKPSDAAMSGRIAMVALLVIALLTWLMIWIA